MLGFSYVRTESDHWVRLLGFQLGVHPRGRRRLFSERHGYRRGAPTLRIGKTAEVSICRLRRTP